MPCHEKCWVELNGVDANLWTGIQQEPVYFLSLVTDYRELSFPGFPSPTQKLSGEYVKLCNGNFHVFAKSLLTFNQLFNATYSDILAPSLNIIMQMSVFVSWSPRGLRRGSAASCLLGLQVRIPPGIWVSFFCECCVSSGKGLCDGLITHAEDSYRVCVYVCLCVCH